MLTESRITDSLTNYLQQELNHTQVALTLNTPLIQAGLIDSLSIFKLILFMEEQFAIKIHPEDITVENFETINALTALVQSKL
ncbi:MAG: acyl carrier protein [Caldilineaceae bacterium]